jgi:hypothetical protein
MKLDEIIHTVFIVIVIVITYAIGIGRGSSIKEEKIQEEIKQETIQRIAYAISSGMITVNHDKIEEIKAKQNSQKTSILNPSEIIINQAVTNGAILKNEVISEDMNSRVICDEASTNMPLPEEG